MGTTLEYESASLVRKKWNGTLTDSRQKQKSNVFVSSPTSGGYITFPDGSRFRLPTSYTKRSAVLKSGAAQFTAAKEFSIDKPITITSSPGGYRTDVSLMTSNCPIISTPIGAPNKLITNPGIPMEMKNEASTKALLSIADAKAGIGEDLATLRQTIGMIKNPSLALIKSLKYVRSNPDFKKFLAYSAREIKRNGPLTTASQKYLEYVYGWKPLVHDIYGIMEIMKEKGQRPMLLSGQGYSHRQAQSPQSFYTDSSGNATNGLGPLDVRMKVSCKIWGRIDPNSAGLRSLNQLGLLNPISLAWELVPFSFVLDWFVPIGPVLQALTAPVGLTFVTGTHSVRCSMKGPYEHHYHYYDANASSNSFASGQAEHESYHREVLGGWPMPGFWVNPNPFSGDRSLKALALTIVNLRGLRI